MRTNSATATPRRRCAGNQGSAPERLSFAHLRSLEPSQGIAKSAPFAARSPTRPPPTSTKQVAAPSTPHSCPIYLDAISALSCEIALAGLRPFGHALLQLKMVWHWIESSWVSDQRKGDDLLSVRGRERTGSPTGRGARRSCRHGSRRSSGTLASDEWERGQSEVASAAIARFHFMRRKGDSREQLQGESIALVKLSRSGAIRQKCRRPSQESVLTRSEVRVLVPPVLQRRHVNIDVGRQIDEYDEPKGKRSSSTRTGCTRTCRRASSGPPSTGSAPLMTPTQRSSQQGALPPPPRATGRTAILGDLVSLQVRLDRLVLLVEEGHIRNEVLQYKPVSQSPPLGVPRVERADLDDVHLPAFKRSAGAAVGSETRLTWGRG